MLKILFGPPILAAEKLDAPNYYVNLASGQEVSIGELANDLVCVTFKVTFNLIYQRVAVTHDVAQAAKWREIFWTLPHE